MIGFGTRPAYAGQPNGMQVIISRDGKPATDLGDQLDGLMGHAYYGGKVDPKLENRMMPLEAHFGDGWGAEATTGRSSCRARPAPTPSS